MGLRYPIIIARRDLSDTNKSRGRLRTAKGNRRRGMNVYVVDRLISKPGQARAVFDAYMRDYVPGARERGMVLERSLLAPAIILRGNQTNRLTFTWSLADVQAWYGMRFGALTDPRVPAFWNKISSMVEHRERTMHQEASDCV
jgi:hypothetical protein